MRRGLAIAGVASLSDRLLSTESVRGFIAPDASRPATEFVDPDGRVAWGMTGGGLCLPDAHLALATGFIGRLYHDGSDDGGAPEDATGVAHKDARELAEGFARWDLGVFGRLDGMFGAIVWESGRRRLVLARDPFGAVPLYYWSGGDRLLFATEVTTLLRDPGVPRELDTDAVHEYFSMRFLCAPGRILRGTRELQPGEMLVAEAGGVRTVRYETREPAVRDQRMTEQAAVDELESIVNRGIARRFRGARRVGVLLSGGLDSSYLTVLAAAQAEQPLDTFFAGVEEYDHDFARHASFVSEKARTIHHEVRVDRHRFADLLPETAWVHDEPIAHPGAILRYDLYRNASSHVDEIWCGSGADSALLGFPVYYLLRLQRFARALPAVVRHLISAIPPGILGRENAARAARVQLAFGHSPAEVCVLDSAVEMPNDVAELLAVPPPARPFGFLIDEFEQHGAGDSMRGLTHLMQGPLLTEVTPHIFKEASVAGLLNHFPYLDREFFAFAARVPERLLNRRFVRKYLFKKALERHFPKEFVYRRKEGFGAPLERWWPDPSSLGRFLEMLEEPRTRQRGIFRSTAIAELTRRHRRGGESATSAEGLVWSAVCFEIWCRLRLDGDSLGAWR